MLHRSWALLATLLLPALLAGCTGDEPPAMEPDETPPAGGSGSGATPPADGSGGSATPPAPAVKPTTKPVEANGEIAGPFEESWDLAVPAANPRQAVVAFALAGMQEGAPPTARVNIGLYDPEGTLLKSETLGLGGTADSLSWTLGAADLPAAGTYSIRASSQPETGGLVPSAGFAKFTLYALVEY